MEDKQQPNPRFGPGYLEVVLIALMIAALTIFGYDNYLAQKISVLDLKGYLRTQKALLVAGEISEEEWQASVNKLEHALNKAAADPTQVVLLKEVVLRNGKEIDIREQ